MVLGVAEEDIRAKNQVLVANIHRLDFAQLANVFQKGNYLFETFQSSRD